MTMLTLLICVRPASANTPPPADFDGSGVVDLPDFLLFISAFGAREGQEKYEARYDLNGDGEIAIDDFLLFVSSFGDECLVQTPWHLVNVILDFENEPKDIQSYCTTFTIESRVPDNVNLYIISLGQWINQIRCYGGIQTRIDGSTDKNDLASTFTRRDRGAIFSRWGERNVEAIRQAPGGLVASSGHEGDFISVRNDFAWSEGTYRLCLRKSDVVEGEPLPANYKPEDIAYGWGRYEHTYVRMEATDMSTNETTIIGELAFPGKTLSLSKKDVITVEIYGHGGNAPIRNVPVLNLYFSSFQVDGNDLHYNSISEVSNPAHASTPVMAQTSYMEDQGIIKIEVGRDIGKTGKIVKDVPLRAVKVSVCDRTRAVRDAIMALVPVSTCGDVTSTHLSAINSLFLDDASLTELKAGDFSNLTGLTTLSLKGNQLSSLPGSLFDDLNALSWLDLGGNQLTAIPSELFTLSNLTYLDLSDNQLVGEIPTALGNLSNLQILSLHSNQLVGEIPSGLGNLSNLQILGLHSNQLGGAIPIELGNLSNLTYLSLHSNQLGGAIPTGLGDLSNLTALDLGNNQLAGEIPKELGNLSNLTLLGLHSNQLGGAIPIELGNLSNLTYLSLHRNQLRGAIPTALGNLSNLTKLYLYSNQLAGGIPTELGNLSNLEFLWFQDNASLMGALPQSLTGLTKLKQFYFNNTGLCAPLDAAFQMWFQGITDASGPNCSG